MRRSGSNTAQNTEMVPLGNGDDDDGRETIEKRLHGTIMRKRPATMPATRPVRRGGHAETKLAKGASAPRPRPAPRPMSRQRVGVSATQVWMHRIPISRSARATIGPRPMHILDAYRVELPRRRRAGPWVDHAAPCAGRVMRGRRTTWLSNGIESVVNHVRPVRCVVRVV